MSERCPPGESKVAAVQHGEDSCRGDLISGVAAQHVAQKSQRITALSGGYEVLDFLPLEISQFRGELDVCAILRSVRRPEAHVHLECDAQPRCESEKQEAC